MPTITARAARTPEALPGTLTLKAHPKPGTGRLWTDSKGAPMIDWEIYNPDGGLSLNSAQTCDFQIKRGGVHRVRVSTVDVFGRPAIKEIEIDLTNLLR